MIVDVGGTETTYYTVTDTQGTMYKLLNGSGTVVASYNYDPFGLRISNSSPTIYMPLGFGGTYYDSETGLYFAQQRYYDPVTGRFTTKDSYRGDAGSPISQNRYIYCGQNPISFADPSGFAPIEGEHASDSTPTELKTRQKEEVKPPEKVKPQHEIPPAVNEAFKNMTPDTRVVDCGGGWFIVNIMGYAVVVFINTDTRTVGGVEIEIKNLGVINGADPPKGFDISGAMSGIYDALDNPDARSSFLDDPYNALFNLSKQYSDHYADAHKMYPNGPDRIDEASFAFCSLLGWAGVEAAQNGSPSDAWAKLIAGLANSDKDGALNNWNKNHKTSITPIDFLCDLGFWAVYNRMNRDSTGRCYFFGSLWEGGFTNGLDSRMGIGETVIFQSILWILTSNNGTFDGSKSGGINVVDGLIGIALDIAVSFIPGITPKMADFLLGQLLKTGSGSVETALKDYFNRTPENSRRIVNSFGMTDVGYNWSKLKYNVFEGGLLGITCSPYDDFDQTNNLFAAMAISARYQNMILSITHGPVMGSASSCAITTYALGEYVAMAGYIINQNSRWAHTNSVICMLGTFFIKDFDLGSNTGTNPHGFTKWMSDHGYDTNQNMLP